MKQYVFLFLSFADSLTYKDIVAEVLELTSGKFGNLDAPICEAMPMAATGEHYHNGRVYTAVKVRLDYGLMWYRLQEEGYLQTFIIDTGRPLMLDIVDEDGNVIGQRPNDELYHYGMQDVLDIDGKTTGETRELLMGGAGCV